MIRLDHVACVVRDLQPSVRHFRDLGLPVGEAREFESEDTREVYVEIAPVRLLLMQPRGASGPIARYVARRGWGFHHLGFSVPDVRPLLASLRYWLVCPSTYRNLERGGPAWIVRPDEKVLVEIQSSSDEPPPAPDVFRHAVVEVSSLAMGQRLFSALGIEANVPLLLKRGEGGLCRVDLDVGGTKIEYGGA